MFAMAEKTEADSTDHQPAALAAAPPSMSDAGADAGSEPPASSNPRKRKKASRACDYCHTNHQPCDNGQPRCSVCEKHNKECTYNRPTKRRGPQKGYRTALNTYKESAAAWGAVLGAIPGLDALIEGHLRSDHGRAVLKAIKDASQQDALIAKWQSSNLFKIFFPNAASDGTTAGSVAGGEDVEDDDALTDVYAVSANGQRSGQGQKQQDSLSLEQPQPLLRQQLQQQHQLEQLQLQQQQQQQQQQRQHLFSQMSTPFIFGGMNHSMDTKNFMPQHHQPQFHHPQRASTSLSDIVANDAARSTSHASQTLAPLGFAPNETIADFYDMGSNPEQPMSAADFDFSLGGELNVSDADQRVFYELLMGRSFDDSSRQP